MTGMSKIIIESEDMGALAVKYAPILSSVAVRLENGRRLRAEEIWPDTGEYASRLLNVFWKPYRVLAEKSGEQQVIQKLSQAANNRTVWLYSIFAKLLALALKWTIKNNPQYFNRKFGSLPSNEQPDLNKVVVRWGDVDVDDSRVCIYDPAVEGLNDSPWQPFLGMDNLLADLSDYVEVGCNFAVDNSDFLNPFLASSFGQEPMGRVLQKLFGLKYDLVTQMAKTVPKFKTSETLIKFQNGWEWWYDSRSGVPEFNENGKPSLKSGHCANCLGSPAPSDRCLMLMEPVVARIGVSTVERWKLHCFAVLNPKNGAIVEMRGNNNTAPPSKLHAYIVALLLNPLIVTLDYRIKGAARNNQTMLNSFHLAQLKPSVYSQLKAKKPSLFSAYMPYDSKVANRTAAAEDAGELSDADEGF